MSNWISYLIGLSLLLLGMTAGESIAQTQNAKAVLARIATVAAKEMTVEGGYTQKVQTTIIQQLQADGFDPTQADVSVTPIGVRVPYGDVSIITISYPVPIHVVYITPFNIVVSDTEGSVSMYVPGSPASSDPTLASPGQGTNDLAGPTQSGSAVWQGP